MEPQCEVVKFNASDSYIYTGLLYRAEKSRTTIIHIHGMCGNMLSFSPLIYLAGAYTKNGYNFLTFDLKAHDCIAEGNWADKEINNEYFYYVGGSIEPFERCIVDIESSINFAKTFSDKIILHGHSMGCERIITFQLVTKSFYDTILLSPCDAYKLQMDYIYPKTIEDQIEELKNYDDFSLLPPHFFGINNEGYERYTIPIYKKALYSILTGYALKVFRVDKNFNYYLPISCICLIGNKDLLQTYEPQNAFSKLKDKFAYFEGHTLNGDHELKPAEEDMVEKTINWLNSKKE
jgi:hypothetical protein